MSSTKEYSNSVHGYLVKMYGAMRCRIRHVETYRGRTLTFSFKEFEGFVDKEAMQVMLKTYLDSGKKRSLAPSVDRIDNDRGYSLDNIRIVTLGQNVTNSFLWRKTHHNMFTPDWARVKNGRYVKDFDGGITYRLRDINRPLISLDDACKMWSISECANYLGLGIETVRRWDKQGYFKPSEYRGKRKDRYYSTQDINNLLVTMEQRRESFIKSVSKPSNLEKGEK